MDDTIYSGNVTHLCVGVANTKEWVQRFLALIDGRSNGSDVLLQWANSDVELKNLPNSRKGVLFKNIQNIGSAIDADRPYSFQVYVRERAEPFTFAAESQQTLDLWLHHLKKLQIMGMSRQDVVPLPLSTKIHHIQKPLMDNDLYDASSLDGNSYQAQIVATDASERCGLQQGVTYYLYVCGRKLQLTGVNHIPLSQLEWPYNYIRRYGRSRTTFTLEAGRKCPSGEGVFTFKVMNGEVVFNEVQERTREMKKNKANSSGVGENERISPISNPGTPLSPPSEKPPLPSRRFGSEPFSSGTILPPEETPVQDDLRKHSLPTQPPAPPVMKEKGGHKYGVLNKLKHLPEQLHLTRKSAEDLERITSGGVRTSIEGGKDTVDGLEPCTAGSYRRSPNPTKRMLPEIPRDAAPKQAPPPPACRAEEPIYEEANGSGFPRAPMSAPITPQPAYSLYDSTYSSRPPPPHTAYPFDDEDRCHSSPADLARNVPLRMESVTESGGDENYALIGEDEAGSGNTGASLDSAFCSASPLYAEPKTNMASKLKMSNFLDQMPKTSGSPAAEPMGSSYDGATYGSLDLLNTKTRVSLTDTMEHPSTDSDKDQVYGRLSAPLNTSVKDKKALYYNTGNVKR